MDLLVRPDRLIRICESLDSTGIIKHFVHVPDKGELYDFAPHVNISETNTDLHMYPVRFGYNFKNTDLRHNMNMYTMGVVITEDGVEINIMFTPNHYDEFMHRLKKQIKKMKKRLLTCEDNGEEYPPEWSDILDKLKEYRFHGKMMRNYFWNNLISFYFDKDKIIQNSNV